MILEKKMYKEKGTKGRKKQKKNKKTHTLTEGKK